jgi:hypothetical protein
MKQIIVLIFLVFLLLDSINAQQRIVNNSFIYSYQFSLFDSSFKGKVQTVSKLWYSKLKVTEPDTLAYISNAEGLFRDFDTLNLSDMFEGIHFDYKPLSNKFTDKSGKNAMLFDTAYKYDQDNFAETILFYGANNFFIHKQNKNADTTCTYMTRLFDKEKKIQRITYYHNKNKCEATENIATYLSSTRFSEMYEFTYVLKAGIKKIASINYYRTDKNTGKKMLYASNKYFYGKNNMVYKALFEQFNGVSRIKGETIFKYYLDKSAK